MLIGIGPALACLSVGQIDISPSKKNDLILQKTLLGWIIGGNISTTTGKHRTYIATPNFDLQKFWEIEEGPQVRHLSNEENACEKHFLETTTRDNTGRYIVALPFNDRKLQLGESRARALNRFLSLEKKFNRDPGLKREYSAVIREYQELGHMSEVQPYGREGFYLPHHAVVKPSSTTTKVRVVFDGSAKSSSGLSLNDTLMTGPTIQDDLFSLLLRFRMYAYVMTGDIEKMYRQFLVRPEDRAYQRILWRDNRGNLATFELNTVTFGLSSAPYLAIRCLHQLADDEKSRFPEAAEIVKRDLYVDDLLTGADTFEEAQTIQRQICRMLTKGGLNIRQWASNDPNLLQGLDEDQIHPKILGETATVKTLGIAWDARQDIILYTVEPIVIDKVTKRSILSSIAKIFDPLGLLAPVIITAKILLQRLWQLKLDWDESIPASLHTEWCNFATEFNTLNICSFSRRVSQDSVERLELHGFCDASERAYGACIYLRSINNSGDIKTELLCAKSRVAPLKTVSLARLELCGAVLLSSLYATVSKAITHNFNSINFWTDSTIVLNWINKEPSTLKTFVANRVAEVQLKTRIDAWKHVKSEDNPADLISRGQSPSQFLSESIWRHGPAWLASVESVWPESKFVITQEIPESRPLACFATVNRDDSLLTRYSCIKKLRRIIAYCLRFRTSNKFKGPLTVEEIRDADERIIKMVQSSSFAQELKDLQNGSKLQSISKLLPLQPFIDGKGILRVGGRLQNAAIPFDEKHPILLPKNHPITVLIIRNAHLEGHHLGINSTLYNIRQRYWLIDGKNTVRKIVRQCVRCFRINPPVTKYIMGNLPATRISESRPFTNCGIDYCGPFFIKERRVRNRSRVKIYVAVFICFSTKAVHLEVVSDMTTEAFIAAFKRFIARRGICRNVYSDNGTNFVGANKELLDIQRKLQEDEKVRHFLVDKRISWHFMPALSPNFGGLWEAAVKSFKHHLKRVVGEELFTFEQFNTFVIEIEAILNSRPLVPLSSDPNDPSALTPAHFLIGNSLTSLPEVDFSETPSNRLSKWQHIQKVKQDFWSRWYKEYIHQLNVRQKWTRGSHEIKEGSLVVMKDDHLPPLQWHLGRVEKIHPGQDNIIRAVTVRTSHGSYRRNVQKLAQLPIADSEECVTAS
ncbi:uncharacterized protein LOC105663061 [Megachile rotundata]|uniref:uncharacterized protein LOC105663061 n=1 Tax=Megachile rotundata TaxID=143995 RepID=UPI003FD15C51